MKTIFTVLYCFSVFFVVARSFEFSELGVTKCHLTDEECMRTAIQTSIPRFVKGIPEYGVEVLDELVLNNVQLNFNGLLFTLAHARLKGAKDIEIKRVTWNTKKKQIKLEYFVPLYVLTGRYKADGKLLTLSIQGDGDLKIILNNSLTNLTVNFDLIKKENKTYVKVKDFNYEYDIGNALFDMTNLFNGNKKLGDAILKVINDNWKSLTVEIGTPVTDIIAKVFVKNAGKFLSKSALEDISLL